MRCHQGQKKGDMNLGIAPRSMEGAFRFRVGPWAWQCQRRKDALPPTPLSSTIVWKTSGNGLDTQLGCFWEPP